MWLILDIVLYTKMTKHAQKGVILMNCGLTQKTAHLDTIYI